MKKTFALMFALLAIFVVSFASAGELTNDVRVSFNDVALADGVTMVGDVAETVPIRVTFDSQVSASDVKVKVWLEGEKGDVEATTSRFVILEDGRYSKLLSLEMPSYIKDTTKAYELHVSVTTNDASDFYDYSIMLQRDSYNFRVDSVDYANEVSAGQTVPVSVVVENFGMEDLENGYVIVSIPELGITAKGYFGDLVPTDECDGDCDQSDSVQKTVYLKIPESTKAGSYDLTVKVYNGETTHTSKNLIEIKASETTSLVALAKTQDVKAGQTATFDLMLVNSGSNIKVYTIKAVSGNDFAVTSPSVVTVGPASSKTIQVSVAVPRDTPKGTYTFAVEVDGKQEVLSMNVKPGFSVSMIAVIVALAIIFVVLLVVLVVLLAKKDNSPAEETETSYY